MIDNVFTEHIHDVIIFLYHLHVYKFIYNYMTKMIKRFSQEAHKRNIKLFIAYNDESRQYGEIYYQ